MPWKASSVMEERLRFVARLLDGEAMTEVCRDSPELLPMPQVRSVTRVSRPDRVVALLRCRLR